MICLCRRRCAKKRIREALQIQENYLGASPKQSVNGTPSNLNGNTKISSDVTAAPIMNMKSVSMHNVAEDSDDDDYDNENDDELQKKTDQNTNNNGRQKVM